MAQGVIQSAFIWGYMATQLLGGTLADKYGGKVVMAFGMLWFSLASLALPLALTPAVAAAGHSVTAILAARVAVVSGRSVRRGGGGRYAVVAVVSSRILPACGSGACESVRRARQGTEELVPLQQAGVRFRGAGRAWARAWRCRP